ncbi:SNF1-related protein kinase regulatory subunit beta-2-like [Cucurbita pepo subsp. pepo]|uniref:SNF1-related protein kinase regulatory subunit beta-2-like n=1 Tax=Cucurbita pepo subsp. pepo TaxID=3664 RepID=UPI000C9D7FC9|nr:SNF1-related protein kinase regulatory subunit beta-2-like [Cucurbita pepo subsp. pepo]
MGNVNGREDEDGNPSGAEEEEEDEEVGGGGGQGSLPDGLAAPPDSHRGYHTGDPPAELMGHSPPRSPRAIPSPLMFTPQVPVVPLPRPDEVHNTSQSWMNNSSWVDDVSTEQGIPTMITWSHGGKEVAVEGSWDNWKMKIPLQRSGKDFTIVKVLPSGVYQYRFIADGQWRYAPDLPWAQDDSGNAYNILDLQDYVPEDIESISSFEPPQSPESSYSSLQLGSEDFSKEPPLAPPHLKSTLLDMPCPYNEILPPLSRPQHVMLNHLYMQKERGGPSVVALGMTHRFLAKYVTVVLYKSLQR